jgi:Protein of unknown function (DUF1552)
MVIKPRQNWDVSRRALLKGLGLGAAMLPALRTSKAWGQNGPGGVQQRLILVLASEGYIINQWKPRVGSLMDQTLPPSSSPLEPYKSYVNFLHPLTNPSYRGAISGHQAYATIFWGGPNGGGQYPEPTGPTLDQVVAGALKPTQRKSLNFQVQVYRQPESGGRGAKHCHYTGPGQAIVPELNPFKTYQTLFAGMPAPSAGGMPDPAVQRLFARRKSVLDYVAGNLTGFRSKVAAEDGKLIDQHLTSIRALEGELTGIATGNGPRATVAAPANMSDADILGGPMANKIYPDIMHSYMDMIIAGLSAGVSHVGTLQISDATGKQVSFGSFVPGIPEIGTGYKTKYRNWHDLGHNPNFQGTNHKVIADKWCMSEFAAFIKKLQAITEPGGTMLDNSLVVWGNHMEDGGSHATQTTPWVTAGKAGGKIKTGISVGQGRSTADAIAEFSRAFGAMPADKVTGAFPELKV